MNDNISFKSEDLLNKLSNFDSQFKAEREIKKLPFQNDILTKKNQAASMFNKIKNFDKIFEEASDKKSIRIYSDRARNDNEQQVKASEPIINALLSNQGGLMINNNANNLTNNSLQIADNTSYRKTESHYFIDNVGRLCMLSRGKTDVVTYLCNYSFRLLEIRMVDKGFTGLEKEREPIEKIYILEVYPGKECEKFNSFLVSIKDADAIGDTIYQINPALIVNPNAQKVEGNLKAFLAQQVAQVPIINIADYTGWCEDKCYLHAGGAIGYKMNLTEIRTISSKNIEVNRNISKAEAFGWFVRASEISDNLTKTLPLLMYNALSLNTTIFELAGHSFEFVANIVGRTGSLKTTIAKIIFNVFNITTAKQGASMKDTVASMELKMFEHKDCTLLVDDVFPAENSEDRKRLSVLVSSIMRAIGDRNGKSRVKSNLTKQKIYPPRGGVVLTSEVVLGTRSDLARSLVIEVDQNTFVREVVTDLQQNLVNLSTHWYYFIEWCAMNFDEIINSIKINFNEYRRYYEKHLHYQRQVDNLICLIITANLMARYGMEVGYFRSPEEMEDMSKIWIKSIEQAVIATEPLIEDQHPGKMFLAALNELVLSGTCKLLRINNGTENSKNTGRIIGYYDEEYYYLLPDITYAAVKNHFSAMGKSFPFEMKRPLDSLEELSVIRVESVIDQNGKKTKNRTHKKTTQEGRPRCIFVRRLVADSILDLINL